MPMMKCNSVGGITLDCAVFWGQTGDRTRAEGDYEGDGKADFAVFRNRIWYIQRSRDRFTGIAFGAADDKPAPNAFIQ